MVRSECLHVVTNASWYVGIVRSEPDGTWRRTGGEVKGEDANGVGSQQPCTVHWNTVNTIADR